MRVLQVSFSDGKGGAARAALRLQRALVESGTTSAMLVDDLTTDDPFVFGPRSVRQRLATRARAVSEARLARIQGGTVPRSMSLLAGSAASQIAASHADVINLHWVNGGMLSVGQIGRLEGPVVWTLHDMWAFSGTEHYSNDHSRAAWREGYPPDRGVEDQSGPDLERWLWRYKRRAWRRPFHIVTPSAWLGSCVSKSLLMGDWPVTVIPNALPTEVFRPHPQALARQILRLPEGVPLVLFGALGGSGDLGRKGFDLLRDALGHLAGHGLQAVIFGQSEPRDAPRFRMPVHWIGRLSDDTSLALLYSAADVMVVPSRQDNLPQTGTEAQACGTPVVAFDSGGLPDVVEHMKTGYLAKPFASEDLANGVRWVLADDRRMALSDRSRKRALDRWAPKVVSAQYREVYSQALEATGT
jgi:glycosyltransferase involved in cell wall biosynthesis